jgi:hypothetical protein
MPSTSMRVQRTPPLKHRPDVSPHLRCELLIELRGGEHVRSLLDAMPSDYEELPSVPTSNEYMAMAQKMAAARSVREYDAAKRSYDSSLGPRSAAQDLPGSHGHLTD